MINKAALKLQHLGLQNQGCSLLNDTLDREHFGNRWCILTPVEECDMLS
jgi:hypothetical protein